MARRFMTAPNLMQGANLALYSLMEKKLLIVEIDKQPQ